MFDDDHQIIDPHLSLKQHMVKRRLDSIKPIGPAPIRVEDIQCAVVVAGSGDDQI